MLGELPLKTRSLGISRKRKVGALDMHLGLYVICGGLCNVVGAQISANHERNKLTPILEV